jgi:hypothetical protein
MDVSLTKTGMIHARLADLNAMLNHGEPAAIEAAVLALAAALTLLDDSQLNATDIAELQTARQLIDVARMRVNYLTDLTQRRFAMLADIAGVAAPGAADYRIQR